MELGFVAGNNALVVKQGRRVKQKDQVTCNAEREKDNVVLGRAKKDIEITRVWFQELMKPDVDENVVEHTRLKSKTAKGASKAVRKGLEEAEKNVIRGSNSLRIAVRVATQVVSGVARGLASAVGVVSNRLIGGGPARSGGARRWRVPLLGQAMKNLKQSSSAAAGGIDQSEMMQSFEWQVPKTVSDEVLGDADALSGILAKQREAFKLQTQAHVEKVVKSLPAYRGQQLVQAIGKSRKVTLDPIFRTAKSFLQGKKLPALTANDNVQSSEVGRPNPLFSAAKALFFGKSETEDGQPSGVRLTNPFLSAAQASILGKSTTATTKPEDGESKDVLNQRSGEPSPAMSFFAFKWIKLAQQEEEEQKSAESKKSSALSTPLGSLSGNQVLTLIGSGGLFLVAGAGNGVVDFVTTLSATLGATGAIAFSRKDMTVPLFLSHPRLLQNDVLNSKAGRAIFQGRLNPQQGLDTQKLLDTKPSLDESKTLDAPKELIPQSPQVLGIVRAEGNGQSPLKWAWSNASKEAIGQSRSDVAELISSDHVSQWIESNFDSQPQTAALIHVDVEADASEVILDAQAYQIASSGPEKLPLRLVVLTILDDWAYSTEKLVDRSSRMILTHGAGITSAEELELLKAFQKYYEERELL